MKKLLLIFAIFSITCASYARKEYCIVEYTGMNKAALTTDKKKFDSIVVNPKSEKGWFLNQVDMLNHFAREGWSVKAPLKEGRAFLLEREVSDSIK